MRLAVCRLTRCLQVYGQNADKQYLLMHAPEASACDAEHMMSATAYERDTNRHCLTAQKFVLLQMRVNGVSCSARLDCKTYYLIVVPATLSTGALSPCTGTSPNHSLVMNCKTCAHTQVYHLDV